MSNPDILNTIMQYLMGGLLSLVSLLIWGYIFYKKDPSRKDLTIFSFCAGVLSVVPIFLVLGVMGTSNISFGSINIAGLDIYNHLETVASHGGLEQLGTYILVSILVFFLMYVIIGIIMFFLDLAAGEQSIKSYQKILSKSFEMPFIFISLGIIMGLLAFILDWSLNEVFFRSMMIGAVEEFAKHLVVRFSNENKFRNINDVIEFSILVALGFAFLENILYFVDRIWLAPCTVKEIKDGICVMNPATNTYQHEVGQILIPFIFRSFFSTLAHVISSGIFGYYYGLAYFANEEMKEYAKRPNKLPFKVMAFFHRVLHFRAATIFREEKILEGALIAMIFHGFFDFVLDNRTNQFAEQLFGGGSMFLIVPLIFGGLLFLFHLFNKPENKLVFVRRNALKRDKALEASQREMKRRYIL